MSCLSDPSSVSRERRLAEMTGSWETRVSPEPSMGDLLAVAGDTHDKDYPFYRDGASPDYLATANTGITSPQNRL